MKYTRQENRKGTQLATQRAAAAHTVVVSRVRKCVMGGHNSVETAVTNAYKDTEEAARITAAVIEGTCTPALAFSVASEAAINFILQPWNPHLPVRCCRPG